MGEAALREKQPHGQKSSPPGRSSPTASQRSSPTASQRSSPTASQRSSPTASQRSSPLDEAVLLGESTLRVGVVVAPKEPRAPTAPRAPTPAIRPRVWALAADEVPVWRLSQHRFALHLRDWWRYSTVPGIEAFEVRECGVGGDCLPLSVLRGLQHNFLGFDDWDQGRVRHLAALQITRRTVDDFLQSEAAARRLGPNGWRARDSYHWCPTEIAALASVAERVRATRAIVTTQGNTYWGDQLTLAYLCRSLLFRELDLGFAVLTSAGVAHAVVVTCHDHVPRPRNADPATPRRRPRHLMLLYNSGAHWQLVLYRHPSPPSLMPPRSSPSPPTPRSPSPPPPPPQPHPERDAILTLPPTADQLAAPLRNLFAASWGREWLATLGYTTPPVAPTLPHPPPPTVSLSSSSSSSSSSSKRARRSDDDGSRDRRESETRRK